MDILFEVCMLCLLFNVLNLPRTKIFSHLQPLDILRLARTNKSFRDLLMNRDSTHIWKAARKNVPDLPEPFPGMSEPAFTKLCFESQCFVSYLSLLAIYRKVLLPKVLLGLPQTKYQRSDMGMACQVLQ